MKKIWITFFGAIMFNVSLAQAPRDIIRVDTTHQEKINKMPMDTVNSKMPVAPLVPDSSRREKKTGDDSDPKMKIDSVRFRHQE
ncbi:MAG: hypothetical protein ABI772_08570 [Bacteroidota bacterium]